jgi:hypothetical protein
MDKVQDFVNKMDMENLYCVPEDLKNLKIGGNFDLGEYRSLQIRAIRCRTGETDSDGEIMECASDG